MKINVKEIYPVFAWKWDIPSENDKMINVNERSIYVDYSSGKDELREDEDVCGICRAIYNKTCPNCKLPGEDCPVVVGECLHNFHVHCISKWINTDTSRGLCPMCRQPFELKKYVELNESQITFFEELKIRRESRVLEEYDDAVNVDLEREVGQGAPS